jgi:hypothetical protein
MESNENMNADSMDNSNELPQVEKRGEIEYIDPRSGVVHFFETEEEKTIFIQEQNENQG